jgi:hypothetical protein
MDLKIDDLLEKVSLRLPFPPPLSHRSRELVPDDVMFSPQQQKDNNVLLDLEYVQLNAFKVLALLNKVRRRLCVCVFSPYDALPDVYRCLAAQLFAKRK